MIREARSARLAAPASPRSLRRCPCCRPGFAAAETADEFVARLNQELADDRRSSQRRAAGRRRTYINVDTQLLNARANERFLAVFSTAVEEARSSTASR